MPALLTAVNNGLTEHGQGGRWSAGECVNVLDNHEFGWKEIPKTGIGQLTVDQVNAIDLTGQDPYVVVEMLDSGTITSGIRDAVVTAGDAVVLQFNDTGKYWTSYGPRPAAQYNEKLSMHWRVTDKTTEEMSAYMQAFNKVIEMEVVNGPDPSGFRRIKITNLMVSATGNNAWEQTGIDEFIAEWNLLYPTCNLVEIGHDDVDVIVEGTFTQGQAEEFNEVVVEYGLNDLYARRRWYINSQGMTALANNDGFMNTTAQDLGQVFRDGLLD